MFTLQVIIWESYARSPFVVRYKIVFFSYSTTSRCKAKMAKLIIIEIIFHALCETRNMSGEGRTQEFKK